MRAYEVGNAIDLNTAASQSSINLDTAMDMPFVAGSKVVAALYVSAPPGTSFKLQTSPDDSTWTDAASVLAADEEGTHFIECLLDSYIRLTVVGAAGAGTIGNCYLLGN